MSGSNTTNSGDIFVGILFIIIIAFLVIYAIVGLLRLIPSIFTYVHEKILAPKLERWAEEYLAYRRARPSQQQAAPNPVPIQTPALVRQEGQQTQGLQTGNRPHASGISEWRNEVNRRRTPRSRHRINSNHDTDRIRQQVNVNREPLSPSTLLSPNSSANETIVLSRPASPTPQVSPLQSSCPSPVSQVIMVPVASRVNAPLGNIVTPDGDPATVGYLDEFTPKIPSISPNSTPALSPSTPHPSESISEHPVTPRSASSILFSTAQGGHEQVGLSSSGTSSSTFSPTSEIDIVWSSMLSPGFPHLQLPGVKFSSDVDPPSDQRREDTFSRLGV